MSGEVTIDITSYYAMLLPGKEFNVRLKRIAGNEMATYESFDDSILEIKRSLNPPPNGITLDIISTDDSPYIVTAWFDEGIIYWYTEALKVCFNEDASYMFNRLYNVTNIELSDFDTSKTISMESLFNICGSLRRVDLSTFNTSNVTNMERMFSIIELEGQCLLEEIIGLDKLDTSKVTN